jgi:hypothetical protein
VVASGKGVTQALGLGLSYEKCTHGIHSGSLVARAMHKPVTGSGPSTSYGLEGAHLSCLWFPWAVDLGWNYRGIICSTSLSAVVPGTLSLSLDSLPLKARQPPQGWLTSGEPPPWPLSPSHSALQGPGLGFLKGASSCLNPSCAPPGLRLLRTAP